MLKCLSWSSEIRRPIDPLTHIPYMESQMTSRVFFRGWRCGWGAETRSVEVIRETIKQEKRI